MKAVGMPRRSVIVPAYDAVQTSEGCVEALQAQMTAEAWENRWLLF